MAKKGKNRRRHRTEMAKKKKSITIGRIYGGAAPPAEPIGWSGNGRKSGATIAMAKKMDNIMYLEKTDEA